MATPLITTLKPYFGSFWDLHNRIKTFRTKGVLVISCCEMGFCGDGLFDRVAHLHTVQNPGACCSGSWVEAIESSLALSQQPVRDIVVMTHSGCQFTEGHEELEHGLRQLRRVMRLPSLASLKGNKRPSLYLWRLGPRRELEVYCPNLERFASPLQLWRYR